MFASGLRLAQAEGQGLNNSNSNNKLVALSLGCYGAALADGSEYRGQYGIPLEWLQQFHSRKIQQVITTLVDASPPDILAFETVPCVEECRAILHVLQQAKRCCGTLPPCWISFACRNGHELNDGTPIEDALDVIQELDPDVDFVHAVGINCCSVDHVSSLLKRLVQHSFLKPSSMGHRRGLVCYPNSGEEWDAIKSTWKAGSGSTVPEDFAGEVMNALDTMEVAWNKLYPDSSSVPRIVLGGCCRTSPQTIAALRQAIDKKWMER